MSYCLELSLSFPRSPSCSWEFGSSLLTHGIALCLGPLWPIPVWKRLFPPCFASWLEANPFLLRQFWDRMGAVSRWTRFQLGQRKRSSRCHPKLAMRATSANVVATFPQWEILCGINTMTIGSYGMCQLKVLSGILQTLEWLETLVANSLRWSRRKEDLENFLLMSSQVPLSAQYFSAPLARNRCPDRSRILLCFCRNYLSN